MGNLQRIWVEAMGVCSSNHSKLSTYDHILPTYVLRWAVVTVNKINGFAHLPTSVHLFLIEHLRRRNSTLQGSYREQVGKVGRWAVVHSLEHLGGRSTLHAAALADRWPPVSLKPANFRPGGATQREFSAMHKKTPETCEFCSCSPTPVSNALEAEITTPPGRGQPRP